MRAERRAPDPARARVDPGDPAREHAECLNKARALAVAVDRAEHGRL